MEEGGCAVFGLAGVNLRRLSRAVAPVEWPTLSPGVGEAVGDEESLRLALWQQRKLLCCRHAFRIESVSADRRLSFGWGNCQALIASLLLHQEGGVEIEPEWTARKRETMGIVPKNKLKP